MKNVDLFSSKAKERMAENQARRERGEIGLGILEKDYRDEERLESLLADPFQIQPDGPFELTPTDFVDRCQLIMLQRIDEKLGTLIELLGAKEN